MNRKNLKLLADFLAKSPIEPDSFEMATFHESCITPKTAYEKVRNTGINYCGSAGCAVGWAPAVAGIPKPLKGEDYTTYSCRVFELEDDTSLDGREWSWMFSGDWSSIDNTARGAAARIYALLDDPSILHELHSLVNGGFLIPHTPASYAKYLPAPHKVKQLETTMNRDNLKLLADFLAKSPIEPDSFDMGMYHGMFDEPLEVSENVTTSGINYCGSAGCAIGWAPAVPGMPKPNLKENFNQYSCRIFGLSGTSSPEWIWLFSGDWSSIDNTARGAAGRIYALLENRDVLDSIEQHGFFDTTLPDTAELYAKYLPPLLNKGAAQCGQ